MEEITVGQIALAVTFLVGLISGIGYLRVHLKEWVGQSVQEQFDQVSRQIDSLSQRLKDVDQETCKNFLVARLADVEKGDALNDIETQRFWEEYEHYRTIGGNSYIRRKVEQLEDEGKL